MNNQELLIEAVKNELSEDYNVQFQQIKKNNNVKLRGIMIQAKGHAMGQVVYIDDLLDEINSGNVEIQDAAKNIVRKFYSSNNDYWVEIEKTEPILADINKQFILERVEYQLINTKLNIERIKNLPHRDFLDLTAIYIVVLERSKNQTASFIIDNTICETYSISMDELETAARKNTEAQRFIITNPAEKLGQNVDVLPTIYILTNTSGVNGATVMLYENIFEELCQRCNSNFYIIPSSIHEVIAVPLDYGNPEELKQVNRVANSTVAQSKEILADNVYCYISGQGFQIV